MSNVELPVLNSYWAEVLDSILSVTCQSLVTTTSGMPTNCYVGHNRPADDCCDHLVVWIERIRPVIEFPNEYFGVDQCGEVRMMMDVCITLRRSCWPVLQDNGKNPFPSPADIDAASTSLAIDAQALWGGVITAYEAGALFFTPRPPAYVKWGDIRPMLNEGGCAGWEMRFTIDLDPCA